MPKEQPCSSKHSPCASSTKNAKDKSNSTTLQESHDTKDMDDSSRKGSHCSSEKDSGYSDGSDWQQTDVEEQQSKRSKSRGSEGTETSQPGQNQELGQGSAGNPTPMSAGQELQPIYIIKNRVLKQPNMIQKKAQLLWRNGSRETSRDGAHHMIHLQQPRLLPATMQLHKPLSWNSYITGRKINGMYLPTVSSYPHIAPQPSKKPPDKSSVNDASQNLSKRVCTEHMIDDTPVARSLPEQHLHKQPKAIPASVQPFSSSTRHCLPSPTSNTSSSRQGSSSVSSLHTPSFFLAARHLHRNGTTSTRHRRFLNTVEILRRSGLLDITQRTKEIMRQNSATEQDIAQLRQHTELLCQATSNPSCSLNGITAWEHLHRTMAESGSYPSLKEFQNLQIPTHLDSARQPESISIGDTRRPQAAEKSDVPQSQPLSTCPVQQQPHSEQSRELKARDKSSEKVTFIPPDSSTG